MVILVPVLASLTWRSARIPLGGCREKMSRGGKTEEARDVILRFSLRCVPEKELVDWKWPIPGCLPPVGTSYGRNRS